MIEITSSKGIIRSLKSSINCQDEDLNILDDILLSNFLRRTAGFVCPCSHSTLIHNVASVIGDLVDDREKLLDQLDNTIEGLIVSGDLLELDRVTIADGGVKGNWIFAAPPGYVARPGGGANILGIATDDAQFLPESLQRRVRFSRFSRFLDSEPGEDLVATLKALGLRPMNAQTWLPTPKAETATNHLDQARGKLLSDGMHGEMPNLILCKRADGTSRYKNRWKVPTKESGIYVCRRPQAYGSQIWGLAELKNGICCRFVDFPFRNSRLRGCDVAWRLQLAIDALDGFPQEYLVDHMTGGAMFRFFSPLPYWASRRLSALGEPRPSSNSELIRYWIPDRECDGQIAFLKEHLWMNRTEVSTSDKG